MESLVLSYLRKYFAVVLRNFDAKRDFHLNLSKGEVTVSNLQVNVDLIRELIGVETLDVKRLYVSNCLINVSPTKLTTVPITIDIDEVDVVLAELHEPVPLPQVVGTLFNAASKSDAPSPTPEAYGTKDIIADGLRVRIKSLNIILQTLGSIDPNNENEFVSKTPPPLLMFSVDNFLLEQTNEEWKTVPLREARKFNKTRTEAFVFRQMQMKLSLMLVPCSSKDDPSYALLTGAKLSSFQKGLRSSQLDGGGKLGAAVLLDKFPLKLRLITQWGKQSRILEAVQIDIVLGSFKLHVNEARIGLIIEFLASLMNLLGRRTLKREKLEAQKAAAEKANVRFRQLMPQAPKKSVVHVPRFGRKQTRAAPRLVVRVSLEEFALIVDLGKNGSTGPIRQLALELGHVYFNFSHTETVAKSGNRDSIDHTYQVQLMLYWIDVYSIGTSDHDSFKLLFYPSDTSPVLTPISMPVMNIHPDADDQEEFEAIERAKMRRFVQLFTVYFINKLPCPALPEYGMQLQVRLRRLDIILYEETILALLYLEDRLKQRVQILNAEIASKADHSFRLALPIRLSSAASLPQPEGEQVGGKAAAAAAAAAAADVSSDSPPPVHSPYKTVSCTLDLNGPLIYYVPSGLVQPMLRVKVGKIVVVGDANVPDPRLGPRALCNYHDVAAFPEKAGDFSTSKPKPGQGVAFTKLEVSILSTSVSFLGCKEKTIVLHEEMDLEQLSAASPPPETEDELLQQGRDRTTSVRSDPSEGESPILTIPEITIAVFWDDSAAPQFQASVSIPTVKVAFSRSLINLSVILASTTISTFKRLKPPGGIRLAQVLMLIPQPFALDYDELDAAISSKFSNDPFALLPSYVVGLHINKITVGAYNHGSEVLQLCVMNSAGILEHKFNPELATDGHDMLLKISLGDLIVSSLSPNTMTMERVMYSGHNEEDGHLSFSPMIAGRLEHILAHSTDLPTSPSAATMDGKTLNEQFNLTNDPTTNLFLQQLSRNQLVMSKLSSLVNRYRKFRKHEVQVRLGLVELMSGIHSLNAIAELFFFEEEIKVNYASALDEYQRGTWKPWEERALKEIADRLKADEKDVSEVSKPKRTPSPPAESNETMTNNLNVVMNKLTAAIFMAETALTNIQSQLSAPSLMQNALQHMKTGRTVTEEVSPNNSSSASLFREWRFDDDRMSVAESDNMSVNNYSVDGGAAPSEVDVPEIEMQLESMNDAFAVDDNNGDAQRKALSRNDIQSLAKELMGILTSPSGSQSILHQRLSQHFPQMASQASEDDLLGDYIASIAGELWNKRPKSPAFSQLVAEGLPPLVVNTPPQPLPSSASASSTSPVSTSATQVRTSSAPAISQPQPISATAATTASMFKSRIQTFASKVKEKSKDVVQKGSQIINEKYQEVKEKNLQQRPSKAAQFSKIQSFISSVAVQEAATRSKLIAEVRDTLRLLTIEKQELEASRALMEEKDRVLEDALEKERKSVQALEKAKQEADAKTEAANKRMQAVEELEGTLARLSAQTAEDQQLIASMVNESTLREDHVVQMQEQLKIYEQQIEQLVLQLNRSLT